MTISSAPIALHFVNAAVEIPAVQKLKSFLKMDDGWYYGSGLAPSKICVAYGIELAKIMDWKDFDVEAFPGESGEILVSGKAGNRLLEVTIEGPNEFTLEARNGSEEAEPLKMNSVEAVLHEIWFRSPVCNIYDSFTQFGGANATISSVTSPSSHQARRTEGEFPSLIQNVQQAHQGWYAPISKNTTGRSFPRRFLSGDSTTKPWKAHP